eukprot:gene2284-5278_t
MQQLILCMSKIIHQQHPADTTSTVLDFLQGDSKPNCTALKQLRQGNFDVFDRSQSSRTLDRFQLHYICIEIPSETTGRRGF